MAVVAMEVAWGGAVMGGSKKRAWGADTEKLMQLMRGAVKEEQSSETLDLLGAGGGAPELEPEFLELDPDQPLPSAWEKCLDLKTGEVYYVNKNAGVRTSDDPRKRLHPAAPLAHEFLGSKMAETLREESRRASTTSSGSFSSGKQLCNLQLDDRALPSSSSDEDDSSLELGLNLSAGGHSQQQQSVCTVEMVEQALKRTEKALGKREMPPSSSGGGFQAPKLSASSSFSSLTSARSEPPSWSHSSPSTSSSSSTSSRSAARAAPSAAPHDDPRHALRSTITVCEAESRKAEATTMDALVMGACTRCLMYVMLHKSDPKCPRCESKVPLDFGAPFSSKRHRVEAVMQTS